MVRNCRVGAWLAVLLFTAGDVCAQPVKIAPVDDATSDATWPRFRTLLVDALIKRDQKFVLGIVDRNVRNISEIKGVAEFRKLWEPNLATSPLWTELTKVLFLGSTFVKQGQSTEVCAPYVYYKWPANAPDDANAAVVAREALVKSRPSLSASTLQTLTYDLVAVADWEVADDNKDSTQVWVALQTPAGRGYLPQEQVRSPLEYRACFAKRDGNWRLTGLEVGE